MSETKIARDHFRIIVRRRDRKRRYGWRMWDWSIEKGWSGRDFDLTRRGVALTRGRARRAAMRSYAFNNSLGYQREVFEVTGEWAYVNKPQKVSPLIDEATA